MDQDSNAVGKAIYYRGTDTPPVLKPEGRKDDQDKIPLALLSSTALLQIGAVLQHGAAKYSANNWKSGIAYSRVLSACLRHLLAWNGGEDLDPESGLSHLAHAGCCIMFLLEFTKTHPGLDDRYGKS